MRGLLLVLSALIAVPLSGCVDAPDDEENTVFGQWSLPAGSPVPRPVGDCSLLLSTLNARALDETDTLIEQAASGHYYGGWWGRSRTMPTDDFVALAADSAGAPAASAPRASDSQVTGTNNQEAGVDEADVLKTDGEWTYVIEGRFVYILYSDRVGDIVHHARIDLGEQVYGGQLLLEPRDPDREADDRLVVLTQVWRQVEEPQPTSSSADTAGISAPRWYRGDSFVHVQVFDLGVDRDPVLADAWMVEGHLSGARLVDGTLYVVSHTTKYALPLRTWISTDALYRANPSPFDERTGLNEELRKVLLADEIAKAREENRAVLENATLRDHLPLVLRPDDEGNMSEAPVDPRRCGGFLAADDATGRSVSTILAVSLRDEGLADSLTEVVGSSPIVYASQDALVLAAPSRDSWWFWGAPEVDEATDLQWFTLDGLDVRHRASGRVVGIVQDSFGIDVADGTLRVATTTGQWGRWWVDDPDPMMNHLAVFGAKADALVPMGIVGGIAPGERIWSARFTDERAYIVTFEQIDPLWIIDLADPSAPKILGELEIPGVSTYIHPLSDDLLLTIGYGPGPDGLGLDWGRIQVSLFDIRDTSKPVRADLLDVSPGGGWSHSGATNEHKAFTYWDAIGVLAIPMTTQGESYFLDLEEGGRYYKTDRHIALRLIDVDTDERTLSIRGEVDHDGLMPDEPWGWYGEIQRSYFLGVPGTTHVSVYAMSGLGMTAHDLDSLELQDSVRFDRE